ncbi:hypothetical protein GC177_07860 [bacterium]|nr:hypothetical protein [bacterium]
MNPTDTNLPASLILARHAFEQAAERLGAAFRQPLTIESLEEMGAAVGTQSMQIMSDFLLMIQRPDLSLDDIQQNPSLRPNFQEGLPEIQTLANFSTAIQNLLENALADDDLLPFRDRLDRRKKLYTAAAKATREVLMGWNTNNNLHPVAYDIFVPKDEKLRALTNIILKLDSLSERLNNRFNATMAREDRRSIDLLEDVVRISFDGIVDMLVDFVTDSGLTDLNNTDSYSHILRYLCETSVQPVLAQCFKTMLDEYGYGNALTCYQATYGMVFDSLHKQLGRKGIEDKTVASNIAESILSIPDIASAYHDGTSYLTYHERYTPADSPRPNLWEALTHAFHGAFAFILDESIKPPAALEHIASSICAMGLSGIEEPNTPHLQDQLTILDMFLQGLKHVLHEYTLHPGIPGQANNNLYDVQEKLSALQNILRLAAHKDTLYTLPDASAENAAFPYGALGPMNHDFVAGFAAATFMDVMNYVNICHGRSPIGEEEAAHALSGEGMSRASLTGLTLAGQAMQEHNRDSAMEVTSFDMPLLHFIHAHQNRIDAIKGAIASTPL